MAGYSADPTQMRDVHFSFQKGKIIPTLTVEFAAHLHNEKNTQYINSDHFKTSNVRDFMIIYHPIIYALYKFWNSVSKVVIKDV